ncbi:uncharacterized protein AMSG_01639 [Thecamonas trahens ATCC 50062]|uniref:Uncharacterized protein n=1 Tax=Thecamonas trahens ATCC 50062 TaxID=461836 RepID=A0A0L0DRB1_THETB|nr:hypothetical protein AMSG_01639 [Thecamonas trahens ATCC 50062]KNC54787.1 hypothetical protein AMSG_01639 [Thecamonas trahens ATCC 50062]|eukprot:XP_013761687.1 hypothetical protein AMSG_01639 [Thecamonas trahens ATCC 50062]
MEEVTFVPANGHAPAPLSADTYAYYLSDAVNYGPASRTFHTVTTWPETFEPLAGRLVVIRDETTRKRTRPNPDRVPWKSPRGWKPLKSVRNLPVMVQYRNRSDGEYKYRMYCFHRSGKRDETVVLLHVTHTETSDRYEIEQRAREMGGETAGSRVHPEAAAAAAAAAAAEAEQRDAAAAAAAQQMQPQGTETMDATAKGEPSLVPDAVQGMDAESDDELPDYEESMYAFPLGPAECVDRAEELDRNLASISAALNGTFVPSLSRRAVPAPPVGPLNLAMAPLDNASADGSGMALESPVHATNALKDLALSLFKARQAKSEAKASGPVHGSEAMPMDMEMEMAPPLTPPSAYVASAFSSAVLPSSDAVFKESFSLPSPHAPPSSSQLHSFSLRHGVNPSLAIPDPAWSPYGVPDSYGSSYSMSQPYKPVAADRLRCSFEVSAVDDDMEAMDVVMSR